MLEVTYTTTVEDYVNYALSNFRRSPTMRMQRLLGWVGLSVILFGAAVLVALNVSWVLGIPIALIGLVQVFGYPAYYRWWYRQTVRSQATDLGTQGVIGRITLTLTDDTLTERTTTTVSVARWDEMKGVVVEANYTFIMVSGLLAAIVPRLAFESDEAYAAVRDFAAARLPALS